MRMYAATIKQEALKAGSRHSYYFRQKLLFVLVIVLVSIVPLFGISYFSFRYYQNSWIDSTSNELASLSASRKEMIELFLADQTNLLVGLTELYPPEYLSQQANLERMFSTINKSGVITDLSVVDQTGEQLAYVGPYSGLLAGKNYAAADWFVEARGQGRHVSDIFSGFRGVPHFVVAILDPTGTIVLRATVNSDMFNSLLAGADVGPGGDAFILNVKGEPQTPARLGELSVPFALVDVTGDASIHRTEDFIYATAGLKDGDWVLVLKEDISSSLAGFYDARSKAMILIVLAIALITSVAALLTSSIMNRIRKADMQRTALSDRMRDLEKMALVGRLAASVSHEINNPLQIIENQAGWVGDLLQDERQGHPRSQSEYQDAVDKIRYHVKRAKDITHKLLWFSRAGETKQSLSDINQLIMETVSFMEERVKSRNISISTDLQRNLPETTTDPSQVQQVFLNVINNAIDAIGSDGVIDIRTRLDDDRLVVEFADSGKGLGGDIRDRIFEPFFTTKDGSNTGLGLSISHNIIKRLGGDIEAKNRDQGGSLFTVTLPLDGSSSN